MRTAILALEAGRDKLDEGYYGRRAYSAAGRGNRRSDLHRRGALLAYVADQVREKEMAQALLTATDPGMFPVEFLTEATNLLIRRRARCG